MKKNEAIVKLEQKAYLCPDGLVRRPGAHPKDAHVVVSSQEIRDRLLFGTGFKEVYFFYVQPEDAGEPVYYMADPYPNARTRLAHDILCQESGLNIVASVGSFKIMASETEEELVLRARHHANHMNELAEARRNRPEPEVVVKHRITPVVRSSAVPEDVTTVALAA